MAVTSPLEKALARLRLLTPRARMFRSAAVDVPPGGPGQVDHSFHYVSLYEHRIGNSVRSIGEFTFIIANGFIASHAYNVALIWLWRRGLDAAPPPALDAALRHNYKKFFAECAIARRSCLVGRAMLLETLIYEQDLMRPLFEAVARDARLGRLAMHIASAMSNLASCHELCHLFLRRSGHELGAWMRDAFDGALEPRLEAIRASHGAELAEEALCDAFAAHQAVTADDSPLAGYSPLTRARVAAFAFLVFSDLMALEASAVATADAAVAEDEAAIDLESEKRPRTTFALQVGRLPTADVRAEAMVDLLRTHVAAQGGSLVGVDGDFPFPESTRAELLQVFEHFTQERDPLDSGLTGTDLHRRGLAQLVAESLHRHPLGTEFLLWRSKRFSVGGEPLDP